VAVVVFVLQELQRALRQPALLPDGGVLGFVAQHMYAFDILEQTRYIQSSLKGADAVVYAAARSLGYTVQIVPMMDVEDDRDGYVGLGEQDSDYHFSLLPFPHSENLKQEERETMDMEDYRRKLKDEDCDSQQIYQPEDEEGDEEKNKMKRKRKEKAKERVEEDDDEHGEEDEKAEDDEEEQEEEEGAGEGEVDEGRYCSVALTW
jgi:hypothetical protein